MTGAKKDPTCLLAEVEIVGTQIVGTYKLSNINRKALEALLHRLFAASRLDKDLKDRFGDSVEPREWFLIPLRVIEQAVEMLRDGPIAEHRYEPVTAAIVRG